MKGKIKIIAIFFAGIIVGISVTILRMKNKKKIYKKPSPTKASSGGMSIP